MRLLVHRYVCVFFFNDTATTEIYPLSLHAALPIYRCAAADEAIFVAPYMPVVYFLTGRSNVSRYDLAIPGNVDGRRIVASLESAQTRCIVYNPVMYPEFAPFGRLFPKLSRYIELNYRTAEKIRGGGESWLGLVRKDASGPWDATAP